MITGRPPVQLHGWQGQWLQHLLVCEGLDFLASLGMLTFMVWGSLKITSPPLWSFSVPRPNLTFHDPCKHAAGGADSMLGEATSAEEPLLRCLGVVGGAQRALSASLATV